MMYVPHDVDVIPTKIMHAIGVEQPGSAGIAGGIPSCTNQFVLKRRSNIDRLLARGVIPQNLDEVTGKLEVATGITPTNQAKGDVYHCIGMGGGGYGDPIDRDPGLVLRDVINGLVTPEWAKKMYGVVVREEPWRVDEDATRKQRAAIRAQRRKLGKRVNGNGSTASASTRRVRSKTSSRVNGKSHANGNARKKKQKARA
jgi:N-methylhydantoinase B